MSDQTRQQAEALRDRIAAEHMAAPDALMRGVGLGWDGENWQVVVLVADEIDGIRVRVDRVGEIRAQAGVR